MKLSSFLLLTTAFAVASSSARLTRRSINRRNVVFLQDGEDAHVSPSSQTAAVQRGQALPATGFCRKRSSQTQAVTRSDASINTDTAGQASTSISEPVISTSTASLDAIESLSIPVASCQNDVASSECLPTITIEPQTSISYVDVTSTVFVTSGQAVPTTSGSSAVSPLSSSSTPDPVANSTGLPAVSSSTFSSSPTPSVPVSVSTRAPSSPASSASVAPSPSASVCPPGFSWRKLTDNFSTFDSSKWKKEAGTDEQVTFGRDGAIMKLTPDASNIVFESHTQWTAPVTLTAAIKSAPAPGIVNCVIFGKNGIDEIDLELIEETYQVPLWHNGERLFRNKDVDWTYAKTSAEKRPWVFNDTSVVPFEKLHDWTMHWGKDHLTWSADGKQLLDIKRLEGGVWPDQTLPFRWGPWAAPDGWAGILDWNANPEPVMQLKSVVIEGCQLD
ncbi:glycoside hydrolase family 16 protein [Cystobasidium minutum MCA 4210]|uniref:glycoside hydrolase family 16 protein n=1 Tax=Cystobasidium minutum MCA 4210 TaxID=1397322 RepID=UPI0034CFBD9B|eukprot:jgi/Rhomi1/212915/estExt_Genemark1.C_80131